jgi:hypothetical protein
MLKDRAQRKGPVGKYANWAFCHDADQRKDFGLTWNAALEAGGLLVGDAVTIT